MIASTPRAGTYHWQRNCAGIALRSRNSSSATVKCWSQDPTGWTAWNDLRMSCSQPQETDGVDPLWCCTTQTPSWLPVKKYHHHCHYHVALHKRGLGVVLYTLWRLMTFHKSNKQWRLFDHCADRNATSLQWRSQEFAVSRAAVD